jgi:voltage-gated potassium channel
MNPTKSESHVPRRAGIFRFSAVEFLIALILLFIIAPFLEYMQNGLLVESVLITLVLVSGVLAVGRNRRTLVLAIVFVTPALVARWMFHLRPDLVPEEVFLVLGLLFVLFVIVRLLAFILRAPRVNPEVLCAALSAYLLLGLLWSYAYRLVLGINPHAFVITVSSIPNEPIVGYKALYFSLITLSTVGYGDIVPVSNVARMLAAMEAMTGTLFIAVLIARLVAIYSSQPPAAGASGPENRGQPKTNT